MRKKRKQLSSISQGLIMLTLVNIVAVLGQTTCNNGAGRVLYERLPNQQMQGFDDDVVRDSAPPFRVLEKCQDLCQIQRNIAPSSNIRRHYMNALSKMRQVVPYPTEMRCRKEPFFHLKPGERWKPKPLHSCT